jgi:hypothetical protein
VSIVTDGWGSALVTTGGWGGFGPETSFLSPRPVSAQNVRPEAVEADPLDIAALSPLPVSAERVRPRRVRSIEVNPRSVEADVVRPRGRNSERKSWA